MNKRKNTRQQAKPKQADIQRSSDEKQRQRKLSLPLIPLPLFIFVLTWIWASWWMGDVGRIARERSFFTTDPTVMHFLWQQTFGTLWFAGRALLTLFRWPWLGGAVVAAILSIGSWLIGYGLHLRPRWQWASFLPAAAWMSWVAWSGFELYFLHESGRHLGILILGFAMAVILAMGNFLFTRIRKKPSTSPVASPTGWKTAGVGLFLTCALCAVPVTMTALRHPYLRPVTRMEVQMLHQDWQGMAETARQHATLSYRPLAAYYAIALTRTGRLADDLFLIRLDYDSLYLRGYDNTPNNGTYYYQTDCNYHAGLFRVAEHNAMELLTMEGPSLYALKHLSRLALLHGDYNLARKYLDIISLEPFESAFVQKYEAMLPPNPSDELVAADPEFAAVRLTEPLSDCFENQYQQPSFLGYTAVLLEGRSMQALQLSLMANLYSKRMPDFLMRCEPLIGQTLPNSIAEGIVTQVPKEPMILKAFPNLQMESQRFMFFLQNIQTYLKDRPTYARQLFDEYKGYYPYYYFFGNLKATHKREEKDNPSKAGVN